MANTYSLNNNPATGPVALYAGYTQLAVAGWSKRMDSDATTYSSSGAQVTTGASGAGGLGNTSAWMRIRDPAGAGGREYTAQRGTTDVLWRIKYSPSAGFVGGSPAATQTPSATDEKILVGGGSDAAPTYQTLFGANASYRFHVVADNAAKYGFFMAAYPSGGGNPTMAWVHDPLVAGTFPAGDTDPMVVYVPQSGQNPLTVTGISSENAGQGPVGLLSAGNIVVVSGLVYVSVVTGNQVIPTNLGTNSWNTDDEGFPVLLGRRAALTAPTGSKGISSMMRWLGTNRSTGDTVNTKARIVIGHVTLPWDGATTPQV